MKTPPKIWPWLATATLLFTAAIAAESTPGPATDRVGFPKDYQTKFEVIRRTNVEDRTKVGTVYANVPAASATDLAKLPYPDGSIIVFEWADPVKNPDGSKVSEADGLWKKGPITRLDVMRREKNFGEAYGANRCGEWEFVSYAPDGSYIKAPAESGACAACHHKAGARDFVFRGRFPALAAK